MIVSEVCFDASNDGARPLDDEGLEPVLLIQIGVHELLHRLDRELTVAALLVIFYFLGVHVGDDVF